MPMNMSFMNQSMIGGGLRGGAYSSRRCIAEVKDQKTIMMMTPGEGFNFDYVGNEEVS
jgi:hypothetical protein